MITNNILAVALLSTIAGASLIPEETTLQTDVSGDVSNGANTWTGSIRKLLDVNTTDGVSGAVTGAMKTTDLTTGPGPEKGEDETTPGTSTADPTVPVTVTTAVKRPDAEKPEDFKDPAYLATPNGNESTGLSGPSNDVEEQPKSSGTSNEGADESDSKDGLKQNSKLTQSGTSQTTTDSNGLTSSTENEDENDNESLAGTSESSEDEEAQDDELNKSYDVSNSTGIIGHKHINHNNRTSPGSGDDDQSGSDSTGSSGSTTEKGTKNSKGDPITNSAPKATAGAFLGMLALLLSIA